MLEKTYDTSVADYIYSARSGNSLEDNLFLESIF